NKHRFLIKSRKMKIIFGFSLLLLLLCVASDAGNEVQMTEVPLDCELYPLINDVCDPKKPEDCMYDCKLHYRTTDAGAYCDIYKKICICIYCGGK
ncbi:hypothetical protein VIGAN_07207800, partial [Vigna angularis var. angularis]